MRALSKRTKAAVLRLSSSDIVYTSPASTRQLFSTSNATNRAVPIHHPTPWLAKALRDSARARISSIDKRDGRVASEEQSGGKVYTYDAFVPPTPARPISSVALPDALWQGHLPGKPLIDRFQRKHDYLRISLTEQCNLRCFYCMPEEGIELSPKSNLLTDDEIIRLATLFVQNGIKKIRLTGGEPTVRKNIIELVGRLSELRSIGLESIGMTTNGIALHRKLPALINNGLTHLNLSLDTLDPLKFEVITRRKGHSAVMNALRVAIENELGPTSTAPALRSVKLNIVVIKGINDEEVLDFVEMTRHSNISVRFIEFMPFTGNKWNKDKLVPSSELLSQIQSRYLHVAKAQDDLNDTARSYMILGFRGNFGFISSMSDHFCGTCNRLRVTADGQIKVCLFDSEEISLRDHMRAGFTDEQLTRIIAFALGNKKEKHAGMEDIDVIHNRPMIKIGGLPPKQTHQSNIYSPHLLHQSFVSIHPRLTAHSSFILTRTLKTIPTHLKLPYSTSTSKLTHVDPAGVPSMVDVSSKSITKRSATAMGRIYLTPLAYHLIFPDTPTYSLPSHDESTSTTEETLRHMEKAASKGPVLSTAQLAGILATKQTSSLIPLCHPLALSHIQVTFHPEPEKVAVKCEVTVRCEGKTGVEMEALMGVNGALLCVWDMVKAVAGKEMKIGDIMVIRKTGGKSGDFLRAEE